MTTAVAPKRIIAYARVSSTKQAGERHSSLETQQERIQEYAHATGGTVVGVFVDAVTGRRDDRREYRKAVDLALGGGGDVLVVRWLDRFGRNPREILRRIWELQEKGIAVESTDEDLREELMLLLRAGMAGAESKRTSERARANVRKAAEKGRHGGPVPFGFRPVYTVVNGKAVVERWEHQPEEARTVREMARLSIEENYGFKRIADTLNTMGMRGRSGPWMAPGIRHILSNPLLHGVMAYGRNPKQKGQAPEVVTVPGVFPPILSEDEWQRLQERLGVRKATPRGKAHTSEYLLGGIARCGHCGGALIGKTKKTPTGRYATYLCANHVKARERCEVSNYHAAKQLEAAVLEYLGQWSDPDKVRAKLGAMQPKDTGALEGRLKDVEKRLAALTADFHANLDLLKKGVLNEVEFAQANAVRRDERTRLENLRADMEARVKAQRLQAENAAAIPPKVRSFLDDFTSMDVVKAKARLQLIVKAVHVHRDGRIEVAFR